MRARLKANSRVVVKAAQERSKILKSLGKTVDDKTARIAKKKPSQSPSTAKSSGIEDGGRVPPAQSVATGLHIGHSGAVVFPHHLVYFPGDDVADVTQGAMLTAIAAVDNALLLKESAATVMADLTNAVEPEASSRDDRWSGP